MDLGHRDPKVMRAPKVIGVRWVFLETMASRGSLDLPAPPALPDLLALAETLLLKWLTAILRKAVKVKWRCPAPWVLWAPAEPLAPLVLLDPKVSLATLVSLESPEHLVPWVPAVQLAPLERTEMMVSLESLAVPVSAAPLALREAVDSPEPLDFLASRDTEALAVWMERRETVALLDQRERLVSLEKMVLPEQWAPGVSLVREAVLGLLDLLVLVVMMVTLVPLVLLAPLAPLGPLASPEVLDLRERLDLQEAVAPRDLRDLVVSPVIPDLLALLDLLVPPDLMVLLVPKVLLVLLASLVLLDSPVVVALPEVLGLVVPLAPRVTMEILVPLVPKESLVPRESQVQ